MSSEVPSIDLCRGYGRAMVRTMTAAGAVPHFHFHDDVNMAKLMQLRRELQLYPKAAKVTMLPFIIKVQDSPAQLPHCPPLQTLRNTLLWVMLSDTHVCWCRNFNA